MILGDRRRPRLDPELLVRVALIWAVLCVLLLATNFSAIRALRFPDPDDTLRLVQVRDLLAGQGWFDLSQHRVDPPSGVAMHWSRLVDLPIAMVILLVKPLLGQPAAELAALIVVPLVTLGCVLLLIARIAWKIFDEEVAGLACLAAAMAVPVVHQLRPMRIDHHGWQLVALLVAMNGLVARDARRGGWTIGASLAVWLTISVEGLPLAAALVGVTALKWLRNRADRWWLVHTLQALAATSLALFVLTRGFGDLAQHCDALSPLHLAMFAWGAAAMTLVAAFEPHPRAFTLAGMALTAAGALAIVGFLAPQCAGGAFVEIDPLVRTLWYERILEGQPLWMDTLPGALQQIAPPLLGLWVAVRLAGQSGDWLRRWWIDYAVLLLAGIVISLFVARASAAACVLAAVPLGWQLRAWTRAARNLRQPRRRVLALAGVVLALAPAVPLTLLATATPSRAGDAPRATVRVSDCTIDAAAPLLASLPPARIFAPLDVGPRLLYTTRHRVVATSHHRAATAMRDVIAGFTGSADAARRTIARRGISYVAMCPGLAEAQLYAAYAPAGFAAQLRAAKAPRWLEPVPLPGDGSFRLWRVVG